MKHQSYKVSGLYFCYCYQVSVLLRKYVLTDLSFVLGENIYGNNSIVTVDEIAENDSALLCYTNNRTCCKINGLTGIGEWYFPNETMVSFGSHDKGGDFYRNRGPSVVRLNRRNNAMMPTGVFRCEIPDASGTNQSIYIGVYPHGEGAPVINISLSYSYNQTQSLECTSIGSPATNVMWLKNGVLLGGEYEQHQIITNRTISKYRNVLSLDQRHPKEIIGNYTCLVRNSRTESSKTIQLNGEL